MNIRQLLLTAVISLFFIDFLPGQTETEIIPDYRERTLSALPDSLPKEFTFIQATEGSINPDVYRVGPGDIIFISISGLEEITLDIPVDQEGHLFIPRVGAVDLRNLTLTDARKRIENSIFSYYKNVDIFVTLARFRYIKIALLGDVRKPAVSVLAANSRLMDLITASGGFTETSDFRNIKIISSSNDTGFYDFLSFLRYGDERNNPLLIEGDRVVVDKADEIVKLGGAVRFPGSYEYKPGETVRELIETGGGFSFRAKKDSVEVVKFDPSGQYHQSYYYSYDDLTAGAIALEPFDQVLVREIPEFYIERFVEVEGFVKYPGSYKIIKDSTKLSQIIREAGGFLEDASLTEATVTRKAGTREEDPEFERLRIMSRADMTEDEYDYLKSKSRQRQGRVVVDFTELFGKNNPDEDLILRRGDVITIPEKKNYVILLGQVVHPGKIVYKEGLNVDDYIELAGGFAWRALENDVRVVKATTGEWVEAEDVESLDPGDTIWILEDPPGPPFWEVFTTTLSVLGQVAAVVAAAAAVAIATR